MATMSNITKPVIGDMERRAFSTIFTRADGTGRSVEGYAAVFNSKTRIGSERWGYDEIIMAGAFDEAIKTSDCRALFNHDADYLLARQSSGTLSLNIDKKGLMYAFESPNTTIGNDILEMMSRGDLKESSFAFTVEEEEWLEEVNGETTNYTRTIKKVKQLYDVSPVTYPAYADTSVAKRSFEAWQAANGFDEAMRSTNVPKAEGIVKPPQVGVHINVLREIFG